MFSAYVTIDGDDLLVVVELASGHRCGEFIPGASDDEDVALAIRRVRQRALNTAPRTCGSCGEKRHPPICHPCDALLPPRAG